jgi:hypothetical protein
MEIPMVNVN